MFFRLAGCLAVFVAGARAEDLAERDHVLVLANSRVEESVALARHYASARGIPERNIIALPLPTESTVTWTQYVDEVHNPLLKELVAEGWIGGTLGEQKDRAGRLLIEPRGHRIAYLVSCRGVPLRIENDLERLAAEGADLPPQYRTNRAAVDSELSLMTRSDPPTTGVITNPLYRQKEPAANRMASVIRVARLDGPDWESCRRLVDGAIEGERRGLVGRAYLDSGGPHRQGDDWLEAIAGRIRELGFDLERETTKEKMGLTDRMDAPALYFGWHSSKVVGPVLNPGFSFPAGAVAVHVYSFSAGSMRRGWVASLVGAGVATTVGNVYEPYLQLTHDLSLFFEVIESGGSVGEAAWYAIPGQSWQGILVGDPLYRPFLRGFASQWLARDDYGSSEQYLFIRKANLLQENGDRGASARFLEEEAAGGVTGLALAYRLAVESGNPDWVNEVAERARAELSPDEWGLALVAADLLVERDRMVGALEVLENLLVLTEGLPEWQNLLLRRAIEVARRIEDQERLDALEARMVPEP